MTLKNPWESFYNDRLAWAERARSNFASAMPSDFREQILALGSHTSIPVAVYGPSQVGKTSLILRIMGIRPAVEAEVGRILRGGSLQGQASTATLMIYRRSIDEHYHLFKPGEETGETMAGDALEVALRQVRARVEAQDVPEAWLEGPFRIEIPQRCFTPGLGSDIHILDLPGEESANLRERPHVETLIKKYSALATTVLLVTKSTSHTALECPASDSLRGWYRQTHRCRLVLTHALSAHSVWKILPTDGSVAKIRAKLREHYQEQFFESLGTAADTNLRIYALEYGESWARTVRVDPSFLTRFGPAMEAELEALRDDLERTASPHNRILSILNGEAIILTALEDVTTSSRRMHADLSRARAALTNLNHQVQEWKGRCDETRAKTLCESAPVPAVPIPKMVWPKDVPGFKAEVQNLLRELKVAGETIMEEHGKDFAVGERMVELAAIRESVLEQIAPLQARLNGYSVNWYFFDGKNSDLAKDNSALWDLSQKVPITMGSRIRAWILDKRRQWNQPLNEDLQRYAVHLESFTGEATTSCLAFN